MGVYGAKREDSGGENGGGEWEANGGNRGNGGEKGGRQLEGNGGAMVGEGADSWEES